MTPQQRWIQSGYDGAPEDYLTPDESVQETPCLHPELSSESYLGDDGNYYADCLDCNAPILLDTNPIPGNLLDRVRRWENRQTDRRAFTSHLDDMGD